MSTSPLLAWTAVASHYIGECFDVAKPFLDKSYDGLPPLVRFVIAQLFIDCHLSTESSLLLIRAGKEWDADIISRAVLEGSLKLTYMLLGSATEIEQKVEEYWSILPEFSAIRHSENAKKVLISSRDPNAPEMQTFRDLVMDDQAVEKIRNRFSRVQRRELEEKWSFTGICKTFASSTDKRLHKVVGLAHNYAMSSHLLHKDADGVGMVWDRAIRESHRLEAVTIGHAARILSDACNFSYLRLCFLLNACGQTRQELDGLHDRVQPLMDELNEALQHFYHVEYGFRAPDTL